MKKKRKLHALLWRTVLLVLFFPVSGFGPLPAVAQQNDPGRVLNAISREANRGVTGTVTDTQGQPLPGVSIQIKGTAIGTITDAEGNYRFAHVPENSVLVFSFMGMQKQAIPVKGKIRLDAVMQETTIGIDEVVAIGYGTLKRSDIATAITSLKPAEFNRAGNRDVRSLLEGKIAGLTVTRTGGSSPTEGVAIQLRGVVSVNGSRSPLVVIDGIPGGNVDLLRPEDIESIEVLKDGSAAAIYGSSANAGVILITTKKGMQGATRVEYATFVTRYYQKNTPDFLDAGQFRAAMAGLGYDESAYDRGGDTDMYNAIIDDENLSQSHNLSVSGGNEHTVYRASVYYNNLNGIALANEREQYGARMSLQTKGFNDMLTFQSNLATNYNNMNMLGNEGWEAAARANPTNPMYNPDGTFYEDMASDENKYARLHQQKNKRLQETTSLDAKVILEPLTDLKLSAFVSIQRDNYNNNVYYDKNSRVSVNSYNGDGYAYKSSYVNTQQAFEPTVEYTTVLSDRHRFNAVGGYSYRYRVEESFDASNKGFLNDASQENDLGAGSYLVDGKAGMGSYKGDETLVAFFGRINYVFSNRYVAQVSYRREGSSKFGANNKWGNFPAASVAWNVTNEAFMETVPVLSNLKLRLGYGVTGNSGIGPYQSLATIGTGGYYLADDGSWIQTYGPSRNPNANLKWETKKEWNAGVDVGVLNNRVTAAVDLYKRKTDDLLMTGVTSAIPANIHSTYTTNIGVISSKGIEVTLNTIPVSGDDFTWKADLVGSHTFSNTLDKFSSNAADYIEFGGIGGYGALGNAVRLYEGSDVGDFYGKRFAGFDESGEWLFYNKEGEKVSGGEITEEDKTVIGNGMPKYYLSFSNYFTYKNFDLSVSFMEKFGFDILNRQKLAYSNLKTLASGYNVLTGAVESGFNASYQYSDYYLENGSYVKLDNITLGYSFRGRRPNVPSLRVYATARDLFTITGYSGETPELNDTGLSPGMAAYVGTPVTRSFTLGLNVQF
ncbi:SusC/RagA family TonB-linked outer membrane protein [Prolixibacter bellariivorans]|uniref:SusC/RagA family TonB-linked outer membrane protein n=2 Tax=Prolixibacter bellariivorans TaxID=314319 RepID=A0A5M4B5L5_9BACT|nr:SusC/RagA family TonB-linked outer membrane protein [Prolixibacter bellariivorans]GET35181.1 SusC/RagA family TonB-linked outer membrane protein [Prolixibacter bellariivorans]